MKLQMRELRDHYAGIAKQWRERRFGHHTALGMPTMYIRTLVETIELWRIYPLLPEGFKTKGYPDVKTLELEVRFTWEYKEHQTGQVIMRLDDDTEFMPGHCKCMASLDLGDLQRMYHAINLVEMASRDAFTFPDDGSGKWEIE